MAGLPRYENYKDSGIEWLGEIPEHWSLKRLKFLVKIKTGEKDVINKVDNGQYPFFIRSPKVQRIDTYSHDEEAVLTAGDGDIGKIFHYINGKFEYHQRVYKFSHFKEITGKFLYYYLHQNLAEEVVKLSAKSTVDSLRLPMLQNFFVCIPNITEQKRIAEFLDRKCGEIDEAIGKKQRLIELLEEQKIILINQAVTKGLNPNAPIKDSGIEWLGEIPEHWEVWRSKRLFNQSKELAKPDDIQLSATQAYGVIPQEDYEHRIGRKVTKVFQHLEKRRHVEIGDFVISMRSFQGGLERAWAKGCIRSSYVVLKPSEKNDLDFFMYLFKSQSYIEALQTTANFIRDGQDLNFDNFCGVDLPLPPIEEQRTIAKSIRLSIEKSSQAAKYIQQEINKLTELKQILIAEAVTGKIKV